MQIGKRILTGVLALFMCLTLMPAGVLASGEPEPEEEPAALVTEAPDVSEEAAAPETAEPEIPEPAEEENPAEVGETGEAAPFAFYRDDAPKPNLDGVPDNDALYGEYIAQVFGMNRGFALDGVPVDVGSQLTGAAGALYPILRGMVKEVAAGDRESTEFRIPVAEALSETSWTAADLGVSQLSSGGAITEDASRAVEERISFYFWDVVTRLMVDCPCEMYWFDKTGDGSDVTTWPELSLEGDRICAEGEYVFSLCVAPEYQKAGQLYQVDGSYGQTVQKAADNAAAIVEKNRDKSDYDKLDAYLCSVCELNTYNDEAAEDDSIPYGNPWQLLWVFDGDPTTNVVCEGYSKAFQYLCDLTEFDADICCYSVWGDYYYGEDGGGHMWNVVRMDDGYNYLVDVTNCDYDEDGVDYGLFLKGCTLGSLLTAYYFDTGYEDYECYSYDWDIWEAYTEEQLLLASSDYREKGFVVPTAGVPLDAEHFPNETFRAYLTENYDWEEDGYLSPLELADINYIDVEKKGIASLEGLEYLPDLKYLYCANNALTALNLTCSARLTELECYGNRLTELDLSRNPALEAVDCSANRLTTLTIGRHPVLENLFCEDNSKLKTLDISGCPLLLALLDEDEKTTSGKATVYQHYDPDDGWDYWDLSFDTGVTLITEGAEPLPGDVNDDGAADALDAALLLQYAADIIDGSALDLTVADVNGDGAITAADAAAILARINP